MDLKIIGISVENLRNYNIMITMRSGLLLNSKSITPTPSVESALYVYSNMKVPNAHANPVDRHLFIFSSLLLPSLSPPRRASPP